MTILCCIKYTLDPFKRAEFEAYAKNWGRSSRAAAVI